MKKPQKYPDWSKLRVRWTKYVVDATVLFKNKSKYSVTFKHPNTGTGYVVHYTENSLTKAIQDAEIMDSSLYKALQESDG